MTNIRRGMQSRLSSENTEGGQPVQYNVLYLIDAEIGNNGMTKWVSNGEGTMPTQKTCMYPSLQVTKVVGMVKIAGVELCLASSKERTDTVVRRTAVVLRRCGVRAVLVTLDCVNQNGETDL